MQMKKDILTIQDISEYLGADSDTVIGWLNTGALSGFKLNDTWKVRRTELEKFIEQLIKSQGLETLEAYSSNPKNWAKQMLSDFPDMCRDLLNNEQTPGSMGEWLKKALEDLQEENESQ